MYLFIGGGGEDTKVYLFCCGANYKYGSRLVAGESLFLYFLFFIFPFKKEKKKTKKVEEKWD